MMVASIVWTRESAWACSTKSARSSPAADPASGQPRAGASPPRAPAVAVVDINGDGARSVAEEIDGRAYEVDVTDFTALAAAVRDADDSSGRPDDPLQQRRRQHPRPDPRVRRSGVGPHHHPESHRRLPRLQGRGTLTGGQRRRRDREHGVDLGHTARRRRGALRRGQGGGRRPHRHAPRSSTRPPSGSTRCRPG